MLDAIGGRTGLHGGVNGRAESETCTYDGLGHLTDFTWQADGSTTRSAYDSDADGNLLRGDEMGVATANDVFNIIGTFALYAQIEYIRTINLGLDRSNLVYTALENTVRDQYDAFRQELMASPGIENVTTSSENPLSIGNNTTAPSWRERSRTTARSSTSSMSTTTLSKQ